MRFLHTSLCASLALLLVLLLAPASLAAQDASIALRTWASRAPCLSDETLARGIETTLGVHVAVGDQAAEIVIDVQASEAALSIHVTRAGFEAARTLESDAGCEALIDAAIVVASLLVDDALRATPTPPPQRALTPPPPTLPPAPEGTVAARIVMHVGGLTWPGVALGVGLETELGWRLDAMFSIAALLGAVEVPAYEVQVGDVRAAVGSHLARLGAGVRLQALPFMRISLFVVGWLGSVHAEGRSFDAARRAERLFSMVELEVAARFTLVGPLGLRVGASATAATPPIVLRYQDGNGAQVDAFQGAPLGVAGSLALDVEL